MKEFGIIGIGLSHSYSKNYFDKKFLQYKLTDCQYSIFELQGISIFQQFINSHPNLVGLNVTMPYKKSVRFFLDDEDPSALQVQAVNTIKINRSQGKPFCKGYNTDFYGFEQSILPLINKQRPSNAIILGTGGAANAVKSVLRKYEIDYLNVSRTQRNATNIITYNQLSKEIIEESTLIVNATPVGMYPYAEHCPLFPFEYLTTNHICFDLIYNPEKTLFLEKAQEQGTNIKNGLEMLYFQAQKAWEIWNNPDL